MPKRGKAKRLAEKARKGSGRTEPLVTGSDAALVAAAGKAQVSGSIWKPEVEGDTLVGDVLKIGKEKGRYGEQTVVVVLTDGGAVTAYANAPMERGLEENQVKVGDRIAIQYKGSVRTGKGRPCRLFAVVTSKAEGKARGR